MLTSQDYTAVPLAAGRPRTVYVMGLHVPPVPEPVSPGVNSGDVDLNPLTASHTPSDSSHRKRRTAPEATVQPPS
jgi:hypothetical protein